MPCIKCQHIKSIPITTLIFLVVMVVIAAMASIVFTNYAWITAVNGKPLIPIGNYDNIIEDFTEVSLIPAHIYDSSNRTAYIIDCEETGHPVAERTIMVIMDDGSQKLYDCGLAKNIIIIEEPGNIDQIIVKIKLCGYSGCTDYEKVLWEEGVIKG